MKRFGYSFLLMLMFCFLVVGCAPTAYKAVDLNSELKAGQYVQKADNFIVLFDKSASMDDLYKTRMRLDLARDVTTGMITTIPDIPLNAGLRAFWGTESELTYGMSPLNKDAYLKALQKFHWGAGETPLGKSIAAGGEDLKPFAGQSAMIIVSDFEDLADISDLRPKNVMESIAKVKADYGDRLCIYTIQVGNAPNGKALAEEIAKDGQCGFAVNADELGTPDAMASFVRRVFLKPASRAAEEKPAVAATRAEPSAEAAAKAAAPAAAAAVISDLENIHFDFDKSTIRPKDRAILEKHAAWLMKNKDYNVVVEGHCDERGTTEYNLALGERRAVETKKYLTTLGVAASRIQTISYGEEQPLDQGHTEESWAKNRRAQFILNASK